MKITPLSDFVLIEPLKEEKTTASGIIIPETAQEDRPQKGRVVAVGPGKINDKGEKIATPVSAGNIVLFKKYGPDEIKMKDESGKEVEYLIAREEEILAIIE
ncbi:MAG: 10 kDa chaperonin [Parcubacteria group bacterium GW2011_GWA1_Parcubacteria_45_10]|nr:MAG: 10 kDa chaperonin [Parcubacteria group bacterium GW2011_GWA1_Parcubacteria_45_10]KKT87688.1 MAG: 10 kDa chaperonin [Parcubacteria group bacterium GW2011_GWB1_45_10]